jgi:hypothetical protein
LKTKISARHKWGIGAPSQRKQETKEAAFIDKYKMSEELAGMGHGCPIHEEIGTMSLGWRE